MDYNKGNEAYKEAFRKAETYYYKGGEDYKTLLSSIFPELAESEDERIRKQLISYIKETRHVAEEDAETISRLIAWLEKQGEQKSTSDLSPQEAMDIAVAKCFKEGEQKFDNKVEPKDYSSIDPSFFKTTDDSV